MRRRTRILSVIAIATLGVGCTAAAPPQQLSLRYGKHWELQSLDSIIAKAGPGEVEVVTLGNTAWVSHHVVIVRKRERPHYHRFHDLSVVVLRGHGVLRAGQKEIPMFPGDIAHIPRGETHFFRNTGSDQAVAFVSISPPFDRRDVVNTEDAGIADTAVSDAGKPKGDWSDWWPW